MAEGLPPEIWFESNREEIDNVDAFLDETIYGKLLSDMPIPDWSSTPDAQIRAAIPLEDLPTGQDFRTRIEGIMRREESWSYAGSSVFAQQFEDGSKIDIELLENAQETSQGSIRSYIKDLDCSDPDFDSIKYYFVYDDGRVMRNSALIMHGESEIQHAGEEWLNSNEILQLYDGLLAYL